MANHSFHNLRFRRHYQKKRNFYTNSDEQGVVKTKSDKLTLNRAHYPTKTISKGGIILNEQMNRLT